MFIITKKYRGINAPFYLETDTALMSLWVPDRASALKFKTRKSADAKLLSLEKDHQARWGKGKLSGAKVIEVVAKAA